MNKLWIGYIIITLVFVILSVFYPYFDMKYQRGLFLGRGEVPWGGLAFATSLVIYYFFIEFKKKNK